MAHENVPSAQKRMLKVQNSFGVVKTVFLEGCSCGWICVFGQSNLVQNIVNLWHWYSLNPSFCIQPSVINTKHLILSVSFTKEAYSLPQQTSSQSKMYE